MGQVDLSISSLGQVVEKSCEHYRGHNFDSIFMEKSEYKSTWNLGHDRNCVILRKIQGH